MTNKIRNVTSDRVIGKEYTDGYGDIFLYGIQLIELSTEKGMRIIVDERRFAEIDIGDQIDIYLKVTKNER